MWEQQWKEWGWKTFTNTYRIWNNMLPFSWSFLLPVAFLIREKLKLVTSGVGINLVRHTKFSLQCITVSRSHSSRVIFPINQDRSFTQAPSSNSKTGSWGMRRQAAADTSFVIQAALDKQYWLQICQDFLWSSIIPALLPSCSPLNFPSLSSLKPNKIK